MTLGDPSLERPLRIAMFSDSVLPILNGVSISVDALVTELRNQGHSVHVYANRYPRHKDRDPNTFRFNAIEFPFWRGYPLLMPPLLPMLYKFRQHIYDVIHSHTPFMVGMVALRWAESHEIPIVSTYHTLYDRYAHYVRCLPRRYVRFRIAKHTNYYYNRVQHVITPTDASAKWLRRHSVSSPVTIIPTGSPRPPLLDRTETRHRLGIRPEHRVLLYVGRLAREKNLETLFQAVKLAIQSDPNIRLLVVGDGPYRARCTELVRELGIGDRVRFEGFVPRTDVDQYYAAADLFVFSSISETQGLVVQEAMLHGLPAVAVMGGGASEAIVDGENGFIVRNDPREMASAVLDILVNDRELLRLSEGARRSCRGTGIPEMAHSVLEVYRTVIAGAAVDLREEVRGR